MLKKRKAKKFIKYLGADRQKHLKIILLKRYDTIEAPDGSKGFGVFIPTQNIIYIPMLRLNIETIYHTIAHEYMHFLQSVDAKPYSEKEAEDYAHDKVMEYNKIKKFNTVKI